MNLTEEQRAAIESRGEERVVSLIEEKSCEVDELLIMTFTNAAAQEMRSRIQARLSERLQEELDTENQSYLEKQIILLSGAQISTFDSFCQSILRRNFSRIDLDPKFRTADTNELDILKKEVLEELFEENYKSDNATFKNFTDTFGGTVHGDDKLHEMILDLHNFSLSLRFARRYSFGKYFVVQRNYRAAH